jgi:hypothetical protein
MRKATPSQTKDHPVWEHDKATVRYRNLKLTQSHKCPTTANAGIHHDGVIVKSPLEEVVKKQTSIRKRKLTDIYHKDDIINPSLSFSHGGWIGYNASACHFCQSTLDLVYMEAQDTQTLKIMKIPTCHQCRKTCKNHLTRNRLETYEVLRAYLNNRRSK